MASRRLSLSTHKAPSPPRYLPLLVDDYLAKAGSSSSAEKEAGNGGKERDLERDASTLDDRLPRRWPPSSTGLLSNASSHLSSWRATNDLFYQHHLPRRILVILTFAFGLGCIVILGAALDVPVVGFARHSWGLFSDERWMDREETYRWRGVSPGLTPSEETPFLLARFGYPSHPRPIDDEPLPSLLHVVPPGKDVFSYLQWLSIASGVHRISPRRTLAHMIQGTVPSPGENFWWDEVVRLPGFEVLEIPDFDEVFGNPVHDISHKADVIRMRALREHGGVYIDTDVLVLRDFKELMTGREEMVLGVEQAHGSMVRPVEVEGLCNAVIVAKKGASFLERWWQTYRQFNGGKSFDSGRESW